MAWSDDWFLGGCSAMFWNHQRQQLKEGNPSVPELCFGGHGFFVRLLVFVNGVISVVLPFKES